MRKFYESRERREELREEDELKQLILLPVVIIQLGVFGLLQYRTLILLELNYQDTTKSISRSKQYCIVLTMMKGATKLKEKVCLIGSGNWGSAIATVVGRNCERLPFVENQVNMWVYDEDIVVTDSLVKVQEKRKLSEIINFRHENVKYLPGIRLPPNVVAIPSIQDAVRGATLLVFVLPHQFLFPLLPDIREAAALHHPSCRGISLIKGLGTR